MEVKNLDVKTFIQNTQAKKVLAEGSQESGDSKKPADNPLVLELMFEQMFERKRW